MPLDMSIERLDPATAVISIHGDITLGTNLKIADENLQQMIGEGVKRMVLDLSDCPYSDSAGLGFLIHANGLMAQRGGAMRLCGVGERVWAMLEMTKTDAILPCDPNRGASLAILFGAGAAGQKI